MLRGDISAAEKKKACEPIGKNPEIAAGGVGHKRRGERVARPYIGALDKSIGGQGARSTLCATNRDGSPIVHRCRVGGLFIGAGR